MSYTDYDFPHTKMYDSDLREVLAQLNKLSENVEVLNEWKRTHEEEYKELKDLYDAVMSGNFPDEIKNAFTEWMLENALDLVGGMIKHVYFGLTESGHFVVTIPENWKEVKFSTTGFDIEIPLQPEFGHLVLLY